MHIITDTKMVSGGLTGPEIIQAIQIAREVYIGLATAIMNTPQNFLSATKTYHQIGIVLGKAWFEILHINAKDHF